MKKNSSILIILIVAFLACKKPSTNTATNSSSTNPTTCLQSSLITTSVPVFSGPDSLFQNSIFNQYYTIYSDGTTADTNAHNTINYQNFGIENFPQSNCPGSYMNRYELDWWGTWIANHFYSGNLSIIGPGDSSLWRTSFSTGRYGVHFNNNSSQITNRWGTPVFSYSDSPSNTQHYTIDYKGLSGVDNYHDIMEIKFLGREFVLGAGEKSKFLMKGEMKLKMRQVEDTSITKNIRITYKEVFTISTSD